MFEPSVPQNNNDLAAERGAACDLRHRFALSAVYDIPAWDRSGLVRAVSKDWHLSTVSQVQTGFPFTISVFGDTANAGTEPGENPFAPMCGAATVSRGNSSAKSAKISRVPKTGTSKGSTVGARAEPTLLSPGVVGRTVGGVPRRG